MLQNGKLPRLLNDDDLQEFFGESPREVLVALGKGMDAVGMYRVLVLMHIRNTFTINLFW
jgi:hypothetical protein